MRIIFLVAMLAMTLSGCGSKNALSPVQLVGDTQSDIAVREFLIRAQYLAFQYDLSLQYAADPTEIAIPNRISRDLFGFPIRSEIAFSPTIKPIEEAFDLNRTEENRRRARADFIKSGAYASMIICRNYLSGLRDRNEYFEFLQKQLGVAGGVANIAMQLADTNGTIRTAVTEGLKSLNQTIDNYEAFKFLSPEIETIMPIVLNAQITLRDYYLTDGNGPTTLSGALHAVSQIEYQCTRSGIRGILNKTLVQGTPQFKAINGQLYATSPTVNQKANENDNKVGASAAQQKQPSPNQKAKAAQ